MPPQWASAGNPTIFVALRDREAADRAWLDLGGSRALRGGDPEAACVFVFALTPEGAYSRMFAPEYGIPEDPATGSSTGPLAGFLLRHGLLRTGVDRFISEQGTRMGRRSILHVRLSGDRDAPRIEVGGCVTPMCRAVMAW